MANPRLRFLSVLLVSATAAWYAWRTLPSGPADHFLVKAMASTTANPPFIIAGSGTQDSPWSVRVLNPYRKADPTHEPSVVSLGDDKEGIFQSSPPSPVDLAVVLKNMRRLGAEKSAISALLAWEQPDAIAISALDSALEGFTAVTTSTPLTRGATGTPIPPTFRRASISASQVRGDVTHVPTVNRLPLAGVILGGENAFSGFTLLENEPGGSPMLAQWDDRFVLSFPLVAVLVDRGLPFEAVEVDLGNYIKLGAEGPYIPIDKTGRISTPAGKPLNGAFLQADLLGDVQEETPLAVNRLVLLRDDQSNAEAQTRTYSSRVGPLLAEISSGAGMSDEQILPRHDVRRELTIMGIVSVLLAMASNRRRFFRGIIYLVVAFAALGIHLIAFLTTSVWPPTLAVLGAVVGAFFVSHLFFREPSLESAIQPAAPKSEKPTVSAPVERLDNAPVAADPTDESAPEMGVRTLATEESPNHDDVAPAKIAEPKAVAPVLPTKPVALAPALPAKPAASKPPGKKSRGKKGGNKAAAKKAGRGKNNRPPS